MISGPVSVSGPTRVGHRPVGPYAAALVVLMIYNRGVRSVRVAVLAVLAAVAVLALVLYIVAISSFRL